MEKLTRNEAIDLFRLLVSIEQDLQFGGMNDKWQNMYTTEFSLSNKQYYRVAALLEKINKASEKSGLIILDEEGLAIGSVGGNWGYDVTTLLTILLEEIIKSIDSVVNFRGDLFYEVKLEISGSLLGDVVALKSQLGAIIFD